MDTIKMFRGATPPLLKKGEWASDGHYAYLGMEHGEYKVFQGVFDLSDSQSISGFQYDINQKAILIPSGTPFSKLQRLFDTLPKALKYTGDSKASIDILFEDGTYVNDLGTFLVLRDFSFQINIKSLSNKVDDTLGTYEKPVVFQTDRAIEIYNSAVNFSDIRFEYSDASNGAIAYLNSTTNINDCCFDAKVNQACVFDRGYNKIVFSDAYFKMNRDVEDSILDKASVGSSINVARSKSDPGSRPKTIVSQISGGMIIAGNVEDLLISEKSPVYLPNGGVEIHGGFVTLPDGNIDIAIPSRLSQLENDMNLTTNFEQLQNKPVTITPEQAAAIEANTGKRSYPQVDENKLAGIEENATAGADWNANVQNKPVTITPEQAVAIETNTGKRSYPQVDENKLAGIEENATAGADWNANIQNKPAIPAKLSDLDNDLNLTTDFEQLQNKPVTISAEQAAAIEANSDKRSYPQVDENKLAGIEENATAGADWNANIQNKPAIPARLSDLDNDLNLTADFEQLQNKPVTISLDQAAAIEANTGKRSYPQADENKLAGIEENATSGADWNANIENKPVIPAKLSDLENDLNLTTDFEQLQNKPVTISPEQAAAIETNTEKHSYPQTDEDKLAGIEESATFGADWNANVQNKPVTISPDQAAAIEANNQKRSYPQTDEDKLSGIEENATVGADWNANIQNKPVTITPEQAVAIETNTGKRSYPQADENKLAGIEENATAGADWNSNIQNKPAIPVKLSDLENDLDIKKLADFDPENDEAPATCKAVAHWNTGRSPLEGNIVDWKSSPVRTATLTADTSLVFTNLIVNKKISIILTGDYAITLPIYCKRLSRPDSYDGNKPNLVELVCTNNTQGEEEVWYSVTPEN